MHDRKSERSSRLRIGGWLAPGDPAEEKRRPAVRPTLSRPAAATPAGAPDKVTTGIHTGQHRAHRRWWRLAAAAAAGTMAVIAIARAVGGDPATTTPAAQPAPVWNAAPGESSSPAAPSPSASVSVSTSPSADRKVTPSPARTTPKPSATTAAPVRPTVSVTAGPVPAVVDLSAEGTRDWVHFGRTDATSVNRRGGTPVIEDLGGTGGRGRYDNNPQRFTWTGADPTSTGVYACGEGAGFTLRVPAGPTVRTLHLYAGVWMATGRLTATVNGVTATRTLENREAISTNRFDIRFRAPAGSKLTLTWKATTTYNPSCGNVDMQAATLS